MSIHFHFPESQTEIIAPIQEIVQRHVASRAGKDGRIAPEVRLTLELDSTLPAEVFRITGDSEEIHISAADRLGLLYATGKFLRTSRWETGTWTPSSWRGVSTPTKQVRGIYFATHFHNFYQDAPLEEVQCYIEDLALWGYNTLSVWFDMHHYTGMDAPAAQAMIDRLRAMLSAAKRIGMRTSLTTLANEAFAGSPPTLRADWTAGHDGYFREPGGHYHVELCPSQAGAPELIFEWRQQVFAAFQETGLDYVWIWPYDQGGCTCSRCAPWGANGFLGLARPLADLARIYFPGVKVVLSTWYFDLFTSGEWEGLCRYFQENGSDWVDILMADFVGGDYPQFILENGAPGGLPLIGFPEISMHGATPWGGFGANPYPSLIESLWQKAAGLQAGGFPYSEGIFEDMNKAICAQLYWQPELSTEAILKEYIGYEFCPVVVDPVWKAIRLLEKSLPRRRMDEAGSYHDYPDPARPWVGRQRFVITDPSGVEDAWQLIDGAQACLPEWSRKSWRWRILYLRALIDKELLRNDYLVSPVCEAAFQELVEIYHAQDAGYAVSPPTRESIAEARGH